MSYSEDELASLTDEERAALEEAGEDDTTTTMGESLGEDDGLDKDKPAKEGSEEEADGADADDAKGKGNGDGKGAVDGDDSGDGDAHNADESTNAAKAADAGKPAPLLIADAPVDADARLAVIATKRDTLLSQFDDGDITAKEFQAELDALGKEERGIERAMDKAQIAAEMRQQQEVNNWHGQVQAFTTRNHPEYSTSRVRWLALDSFVKEFGSDSANSGLSGAQILAKAHEAVIADLGEAPSKDNAGAQKQAPLKGSKVASPRTLAKVPAAESNTMEDSRWTALDRLQASDPIAHEDKLMKLSEAEREAYLSR